MLWSTLDSTGSTVGSITLFSPALESAGYQDFNACIVGSIFVPAGGTYAIQIQNKDQIMFGIGGGATGTGGAVFGSQGQAITVVNALPLIYVSNPSGEAGSVTETIEVTFPAVGIYSFEIDWDYWSHSGRSMILEMAPTAGAAVAVLPPLPQGVREDVSYGVKYRASETGAVSNPSPLTDACPADSGARQIPSCRRGRTILKSIRWTTTARTPGSQTIPTSPQGRTTGSAGPSMASSTTRPSKTL